MTVTTRADETSRAIVLRYDGARDGHKFLLEAYEDFLTLQRSLNILAHKSCVSYLRIARHFLRFYSTVPIEHISPELIERYLIAQKTLGPRSKATQLMVIRSFFRWLVRHEHRLHRNPCLDVDKPRWHGEPRQAVSEEDFVAICRVCRSVEEIVTVELLYHTGLRVREFLTLRLQQVDFAHRRILVTGKGGRKDLVYFPPHVADLLDLHIHWPPYQPHGWHGRFGARGDRVQHRPTPGEWLFPGTNNQGPRHVNLIGPVLRRIGRDSGLPYKLTAHLFRHGLARTLKLSEMPLAAIQQIMRHRSITTTINLYGRLMPDDVQAVYDKYMRGRA